MTPKLKKAIALLRAVLREIFDETAYQRFLRRTHLAPSGKSYAAFRVEQEKATAPRPRCC
jgi:hypothetical protein